MDSRLHTLLTSLSSGEDQVFANALSHGVADYLVDCQFWRKEEKARKVYLSTIARGMKMVSHLSKCVQALTDAGVPCLCFKGPVSSQLLFGGPFRRSYGDLDLLVPTSGVRAAQECLIGLGCRPTYPNLPTRGQRYACLRFYKAQTLYSERVQCSIDLHWDLFSQWIAFRVPFQELWRTRQSLALGEVCEVETFSPEYQILFAAFHGSQDGWLKLKCLLDLALALDRLGYNYSLLCRAAGPRLPLLNQALSLAVDVLGAPSPPGFVSSFETSAQAEGFLIDGILKGAEPTLSLLRPGLWSTSPWNWAFQSCRAILTPSIEDIAQVAFPKQVSSLYVALRVARLLRKLVSKQGR